MLEYRAIPPSSLFAEGVCVTDAAEKRRAERLKVCCKMEIHAPGSRYGGATRPALSVDISASGVCANTPCALEPGTQVEIVINTSDAADALGLPESLRGLAEVCRVQEHEGGWRKVALAFAPAFAQSMELAFYIAYLFGVQQNGGPTLALA